MDARSPAEALAEMYDVAKDGLFVLATKYMRLQWKRGAIGAISDADAELEDDIAAGIADGNAQAVAAAACKDRHRALLTRIFKDGVIKYVVPVCVELKHLLEQQRSPLLRDLLQYLHYLFTDHNEEMQGGV